MLIWIALLFFSVAVFGLGALSGKRNPRFYILLALGLAGWLMRVAIISFWPEDVTVSEDYLNGMTFRLAAMEIAILTLWVLACSYAGRLTAKMLQRMK